MLEWQRSLLQAVKIKKITAPSKNHCPLIDLNRIFLVGFRFSLHETNFSLITWFSLGAAINYRIINWFGERIPLSQVIKQPFDCLWLFFRLSRQSKKSTLLVGDSYRLRRYPDNCPMRRRCLSAESAEPELVNQWVVSALLVNWSLLLRFPSFSQNLETSRCVLINYAVFRRARLFLLLARYERTASLRRSSSAVWRIRKQFLAFSHSTVVWIPHRVATLFDRLNLRFHFRKCFFSDFFDTFTYFLIWLQHRSGRLKYDAPDSKPFPPRAKMPIFQKDFLIYDSNIWPFGSLVNSFRATR